MQYVNSRSIYEGSLSADSLKWQYYNNRTSMENLVLNERLRELSFEGKRWYDLLRYNYRHIDAADYSKTLYRLNEEGYTFSKNDQNFLNLVTRKYTSGGQAAAAKMRSELYLYWPVNHSDMVVNRALHQNPAYSDEDEFVKN